MKYMHREEELVTWYSSSAGSAELHRIAPHLGCERSNGRRAEGGRREENIGRGAAGGAGP